MRNFVTSGSGIALCDCASLYVDGNSQVQADWSKMGAYTLYCSTGLIVKVSRNDGKRLAKHASSSLNLHECLLAMGKRIPLSAFVYISVKGEEISIKHSISHVYNGLTACLRLET